MLLATGCVSAMASGSSLTQNVKSTKINTDDVVTESDPILKFTAEMFNLALADGEENVFLSPLSAYLALAMLTNGAKGDTLDALLNVLGGEDLESLNILCRALINSITDTENNTIINIADSVWFEKNGFTVNDEFLNNAVNYFDSDAFAVDFSKTSTVKEINNWISDKTEGLIKEMLTKLDPATVAILVNTIYFNAKWQDEFTRTYKDKFNGTETDFMALYSVQMKYFNIDGAEGVIIPYDDGRNVFIAMKDGAELDVKKILSSADDKLITLNIPKFKLDYSKSLKDILSLMGIEIIFDEILCDVENIGTLDGGKLFVNDVVQNTAIEFNEAGTEAAAATVVEVFGTSAPIVQPYVITFDKPFNYMIFNLDTEIPLFIGRLDKPVFGE